MKFLIKLFSLWLLLLAAQQGAVVHELSHLTVKTAQSVLHNSEQDATCGLCPSYLQASSPAFGHSFELPLLPPALHERLAASVIAAIDADVPLARSRGPPA